MYKFFRVLFYVIWRHYRIKSLMRRFGKAAADTQKAAIIEELKKDG